MKLNSKDFALMLDDLKPMPIIKQIMVYNRRSESVILPEYDQVHLVLISIIELVQTLVDNAVHVVDHLDLFIDPFLDLQVGVHEVAEHKTAQVLLIDRLGVALLGYEVLEDGIEVLLEDVLHTRLDRVVEPDAVLIVNETVVEDPHGLVDPEAQKETLGLHLLFAD